MKNTESEQIDFMLRSITLHDDEVAFRYLFEHYYPSLCLFAKRFIDDRETREDIVQEVFFRLWDKRKQITVTSSAQNYLLTSVRNLCLNYLRRQEVQQPFEESLFDQPFTKQTTCYSYYSYNSWRERHLPSCRLSIGWPSS